MAYPKPLLPLNGEDARKFHEDLENFSLTDKQKANFIGLRERMRGTE